MLERARHGAHHVGAEEHQAPTPPSGRAASVEGCADHGRRGSGPALTIWRVRSLESSTVPVPGETATRSVPSGSRASPTSDSAPRAVPPDQRPGPAVGETAGAGERAVERNGEASLPRAELLEDSRSASPRRRPGGRRRERGRRRAPGRRGARAPRRRWRLPPPRWLPRRRRPAVGGPPARSRSGAANRAVGIAPATGRRRPIRSAMRCGQLGQLLLLLGEGGLHRPPAWARRVVRVMRSRRRVVPRLVAFGAEH